MNDEEKKAICDKLKTHGYRNVNIFFEEYKNLKINWSRCKGSFIDFLVSDFIEDAPAYVIEGVLNTAIMKIESNVFVGYDDRTKEYLTSKEFRDLAKDKYLSRFDNISDKSIGKYKDLNERVNNLKKRGLINKDNETSIYWTKKPITTNSGYYSTLFDNIAISSIFDNCDMPDYVLDYVIYWQYIKLIKGLVLFDKMYDFDENEALDLFGYRKEAEEYIHKNIGVNL